MCVYCVWLGGLEERRGEIPVYIRQQTNLSEIPLGGAQKSVDDASLARGQRVGRAVLSVHAVRVAPVEGVLGWAGEAGDRCVGRPFWSAFEKTRGRV